VWALALLSGDEALLTLLKAQADPLTFWDRFAAHWQVTLGNVQRFRGGLVFKAHRL